MSHHRGGAKYKTGLRGLIKMNYAQQFLSTVQCKIAYI
jgi:hypothetical protein